MNCTRCGAPIPEGAARCPACGSSVRYGGNTEFFGKASQSKLRFWDIFSDVFKKHSKKDGESLFMAGQNHLDIILFIKLVADINRTCSRITENSIHTLFL